MAKILLVYAVPGSGHEQAARALSENASAGTSVEMEEYHLGMEMPLLSRGVQWFKKHLLQQTPGLWRRVHGNRRYANLVLFLIRWFLRHGWLGLRERLREQRYEAIVATHCLMIQLLGEARLLGLLSIPVYGIVTDFRSHAYWGHRGIDGYFASTEEARMDLIREGIRVERILVTGIPVRESYVQSTRENHARNTILVVGGNAGLFPYENIFNIVERLSAEGIAWIFFLGTNRKMHETLQIRLSHTKVRHIRLLSHQKNMMPYLRRAAGAITKAGGLFCSEALVSGLPLIVYRPFPGQEEGNALYLESRGAAFRVASAEDAVHAAGRLVDDSVLRQTMSQAALRLAHPEASHRIIRHLSNACL